MRYDDEQSNADEIDIKISEYDDKYDEDYDCNNEFFYVSSWNRRIDGQTS